MVLKISEVELRLSSDLASPRLCGEIKLIAQLGEQLLAQIQSAVVCNHLLWPQRRRRRRRRRCRRRRRGAPKLDMSLIEFEWQLESIRRAISARSAAGELWPPAS